MQGKGTGAARAVAPDGPGGAPRWPLLWGVVGTGLPLLGQISLILIGLGWYQEIAGRLEPSRTPAFTHAAKVIQWEDRLGLLIEPRFQDLIAHWGGGALRPAAMWIYLHGYITCPLCALLWLFLFRREAFAAVRDTVLLSSAGALALYELVPLAPPRLTLSGRPWALQDWIHGSYADGRLTASVAAHVGFDPYAALPSMHLLWALMTAMALMAGIRRWPLRLLAGVYPVAMAVSVVATGNHYVFDCLGSALLLALSSGVVLLFRRAGRHAYQAGTRGVARFSRLRLGGIGSGTSPLDVLMKRLEAPLWLGGATVLTMLVADHSTVTVIEVCLFAGAVAAMMVWTRPLSRRTVAGAPVTDALAGLLFVAGAAALTGPPDSAPVQIATALRLVACLLALMGRLHSAEPAACHARAARRLQVLEGSGAR